MADRVARCDGPSSCLSEQFRRTPKKPKSKK